MEYASYTAVPLVSQLRTLVQKLQKGDGNRLGGQCGAAVRCGSVHAAHQPQRCPPGGALPGVCPWRCCVVCLVLGVGVKR